MEEQRQPDDGITRLAVDIPSRTFRRTKAAAALIGVDLKVFVAETLDERVDEILEVQGQ